MGRETSLLAPPFQDCGQGNPRPTGEEQSDRTEDGWHLYFAIFLA
jgi:hypothetical protein